MIIETTEEGDYRYKLIHSGIDKLDDFGGGTMESHSAPQMGNAFDDYVHIKILVPWLIQEKTGVNFYFNGNTWGIKQHWDDIIILPGIVNFKNQHNAHINMLVKKDRRIELEHNTPLIYCIPLSEATLKVKNYLATDQEYKHIKQSVYGFSFTGAYKKRLKLKK